MDIGGVGQNPLQQQAMEALQNVGQEQAGPGAPAAPAANDVERLQAALEKPDAAAVPPEVANASAAPQSAAPAATEPLSVGDRILQGMSSVSDQVQAGRTQAVEALGKENVSQADLLKAQFSMLESNAIVSAVSKTTEKITSGIKTLQQGQ